MTPNEHLRALTKAIDGAIDAFIEATPEIEHSVMLGIERLLREIQLTNDSVKVTVENLRLVAKMRSQLELAILENPKYQAALGNYMDAFKDVTVLHTRYFDGLFADYKAAPLLAELEKQTAIATVHMLTRGGMSSNVIDPIQDILRKNITTGTKYTDLVKSIREFVDGRPDELGHIHRYVKQVATDALRQFSSQYMDIASQDLGLDWFQYDGDVIQHTRPFCEAMVAKRWYHRLEIPTLLTGKVGEKQVGINADTNRPYGMYPITNKDNFHIYRGGYNCRHTPIPVPEDYVPQEIRIKIYTTFNVPFDNEGFKMVA